MKQCRSVAVDSTVAELCRDCCYQDGSEDIRRPKDRAAEFEREKLFPYQLETLIEPLFWRTQ